MSYPKAIGKASLLWVGEAFYKTPEEFLTEAQKMGISRRISTVPKGFEPGKTWVLLAHRKCTDNNHGNWVWYEEGQYKKNQSKSESTLSMVIATYPPAAQ